ncbi:site-2 protease family protein [Faecalicoccus acidiformans]|uniref:Site-2 protease family protein n=1 Tax=Faecalicoccus acidiformans TaxID=915173 RepID=A0ABS2FMW6_9FIRM|nr:site-2 protease family protein [Faecalicoccus acidiformans]MBM6831368.1 site-2 protease family protein [Faecalicoccus acidiformans]
MLWNLEYIVSLVIAVILAMSIHEMAHGLVSYWLGDPTAKLQGRISLNPFAHVDWLGVLCLLLFHFGWAKPVPVDPSYYKDRKTGIIWTSFAGPVANFLLAFVCIFCLILILKLNPLFLYSNLGSLLESILSMTATLNIGFGLFNLIPVPPLDGSKVLFAFLPDEQYYRFIQGSPFFMLVLVVLIYLGILSQPLSMMQNGIWNAFVQICSFLLGM